MSTGTFFPPEVERAAGESLRKRIADGQQTVTVQQHCDGILYKTGEQNCRDTHWSLQKTQPGFETTPPETYCCESPTDLLSRTLLLDLSLTSECPRAQVWQPISYSGLAKNATPFSELWPQMWSLSGLQPTILGAIHTRHSAS